MNNHFFRKIIVCLLEATLLCCLFSCNLLTSIFEDSNDDANSIDMSNSGKYSIYIDPVLFSDESAQTSNAGTSRAAFAKSIPTAAGYVAYILTTTENAILACTKFSASETKVINMSTLYDTAVTLSVYAFDETNYASLASVTFTKDNLASCLAKSFAGASNSITKDDFYDGSTSTAIKFTLLPISKNITVNSNSSNGKGSYSLKIKFPLTVNGKAISKVTYPISGTSTNVTPFTGDEGDESNCTITASSTSISVGQQYIYIYFYTKNAASQEVLIKTLPVCLNIWQNLTTEFYQIGNSSALSDTLTLTAADFSATSSAPGSVTADFIEPSGTVASTPINWYTSVSDQITSSSSVSTFTDATSSASTFFYSFEGTTAPEQNLKIRFEITTSLSGQSFTFSRQTYTYTSYNASTMSSSLEENFSYTADSTHSSFTIEDIVLAAGRNEFILTMKAPDGISTTKYYFCVLNPYAYVTATATNANASDTLTLDSTTNRYSLGSGTNDLPFATVQHAINVFSGANYQRKNKLSSTTTIDTTQYTILVTGLPTAPTDPVNSRYAYYSASDTVYCFDLKIAGTQGDCSKDGLENTTSSVGVLYLQGSSTASSNQRMKLTLKDIHLSGGNIPTDNGGGLYASYTDVTLDNVIIGSCTEPTTPATATSYSNSALQGGGVYITYGTLTFTGTDRICGNYSSTNGGGIYIAQNATTASSSLTNFTVSYNGAGTNGGGIYFDNSGSLADGVIKSNIATNGSGAYQNATSVQLSGNVIFTSDNDYYLPAGNCITVPAAITTSSLVATITPADYTKDILCFDSDANRTAYLSKFAVTPSLSGSDTNNYKIVADSTTTTSTSFFAKPELISATETNLVITDVYSWKTAISTMSSKGAGLYTLSFGNSATTNVDLTTLDSTSAMSISSGYIVTAVANTSQSKDILVKLPSGFTPFVVQGGCLTFTNDTDSLVLTLTGNNTERSTPFIQTNGTLILNGALQIDGFNDKSYSAESDVANESKSLAAISIGQGGTCNMNGGVIYNATNATATAPFCGRAFYLSDTTSSLTISSGSIYNLFANYGAAIYADKGTVIVSGGTLGTKTTTDKVSLKAYNDGGAIYMAGGTLSISSSSTIGGVDGCNNVANGNGGSIYMKSGTITMSGGTLKYSKAVSGGALYMEDGTFTMSGGSIVNNTATASGGAVYIADGTFTMSGGTIGDSTKTTYSSTTNYSNLASEGAGIYFAGGTGEIKGTASIVYNTAYVSGGSENNGGGLYIATAATVSFADTATIKYNCSGNGSGIYLNGGTFTATGGTIVNNYIWGTGNGQSIYLKDGTVDMSGNTVLNQIYLCTDKYIVISGALTTTGSSAAIIDIQATPATGIQIVNGKSYTLTSSDIAKIKYNGSGGFTIGSDGTLTTP